MGFSKYSTGDYFAPFIFYLMKTSASSLTFDLLNQPKQDSALVVFRIPAVTFPRQSGIY